MGLKFSNVCITTRGNCWLDSSVGFMLQFQMPWLKMDLQMLHEDNLNIILFLFEYSNEVHFEMSSMHCICQMIS